MNEDYIEFARNGLKIEYSDGVWRIVYARHYALNKWSDVCHVTREWAEALEFIANYPHD